MDSKAYYEDPSQYIGIYRMPTMSHHDYGPVARLLLGRELPAYSEPEQITYQ